MSNIAKLQEIVDNRHYHLDLAKFAVEMNGPMTIDHSIGSEQEAWLVRQRDPAADHDLEDARVFLSGGGDYDQLSDDARAWVDLLDEAQEPEVGVDEVAI